MWTYFVMMFGSKALTYKQAYVRLKSTNFDACGLFRATHSHNPIQYSHIVGLSSHFYAHIGAGHKVFHPLISKLMWVKDFVTLASIKILADRG